MRGSDGRKGMAAMALASFTVMVALPAGFMYDSLTGGHASLQALAEEQSASPNEEMGRSRRLQQTSAFSFDTKTAITLCLEQQTNYGEGDMEQAMRDFFDLNSGEDSTRLSGQGSILKVKDEEATSCKSALQVDTFNGEQFSVRIFNEPSLTESASDIASTHVDKVYSDREGFLTAISESLLSEQDTQDTRDLADSMFLSSLGFIVVWPEGDLPGGGAGEAPPTSPRGVHTIGDKEVYWPWWAWLLYAALLLLCIIPLALCVIKKRKDMQDAEVAQDPMKKKRVQEGLEKIHGPEWGMTEVDFDDNVNDADPTLEMELSHVTQADKGHVRGPSAGVVESAWRDEVGVAASKPNDGFDIDEMSGDGRRVGSGFSFDR